MTYNTPLHQASRGRAPSVASSHRRHRAGFSLVELVVVVGIIIVLVGLTVAVLTSLTRGSESRTTANLLTLLDSAYAEWRISSERDVSYGVDGQPQAGVVYEIQQAIPSSPPGTGIDHEPTDELLAILNRHAPARQILANLSGDLLRKHDPSDELTVFDAWETEIITVFPGRLWVSGDPGTPDTDGTIRTPFEQVFGACVNRRIRFVSAGPDGRFGDLSAAVGTPLYEETKDNIYSYPLETP